MGEKSMSRDGPYLQAAIICEKVLEEKDGTKSAIRMIDRVTRTVVATEPPQVMEPFNFSGALLVKFKAGFAKGTAQLRIELVKPSGEIAPPIRAPLSFEGEEDRGIDVMLGLNVKFEMAGIYWFSVYLDDAFVTKVPLRVVYLPQYAMRPQA